MISNDINNLISMAEKQSDERLAQELNPETETGLLGPAFISASELAYRQKIRAEAQAQPNNNPPIVQQLQQQAMPQQMPMQQPPMQQQQPMPQQQAMPQQMPMQQQMSPQGYAMGGLIKMANGGLLADEQAAIDKIRKDKETQNYVGQIGKEQRGIVGNILSGITYGAGDADALKYYVEQGKTSPRLTDALGRKGLPLDATPEMVTAYNSGTPATAFQSAVGTTPTGVNTTGEVEVDLDSFPTNYSPIDLQKSLNAGVPTYIGDPRTGTRYVADDYTSGGATSIQTNSLTPLINKVNLGGIDKPITSDTISNINNTDQVSNADTATKLKNVALNVGKPKLTGASVETSAATSVDKFGRNVPNADDVFTKPVEIVEVPNSVSQAADKDGKIAALSEYEQLLEERISGMTDSKGKMQDKWLRIAAGAFSAAQKGSPTLLGGLADLGGGVTEQLLAFNADEQKQANDLFALYTAREELRRETLTTERDRNKDEKTRLADAIKNWHTVKAKYNSTDIASGIDIEVLQAENNASYADQGVEGAKEAFGRGIKQIRAAQDKIYADLKEESATSTVSNDEYAIRLDKYLTDNPAMKVYFDNYQNRRGLSEEWLEVKLLEDDG